MPATRGNASGRAPPGGSSELGGKYARPGVSEHPAISKKTAPPPVARGVRRVVGCPCAGPVVAQRTPGRGVLTCAACLEAHAVAEVPFVAVVNHHRAAPGVRVAIARASALDRAEFQLPRPVPSALGMAIGPPIAEPRDAFGRSSPRNAGARIAKPARGGSATPGEYYPRGPLRLPPPAPYEVQGAACCAGLAA